MKSKLKRIYQRYGIGTDRHAPFLPMVRLVYLRAKELCLLAVCLSVFVVAQAKPTPPQKGAVKGQTKVAGKNLKAAVTNSITPAITGHTVNLTCTSSTSAGVTGYNFYRGPTAGTETATALNATPASTCAWTDGTVIGTNTYFYTAKAFCPTCNPQLSIASNEVGPVLIPADAAPNPPTGLSVGTITQNNVPLFWNTPPAQSGYDVLATEIFRGTSPSLPNPPRIATLPGWIHAYTDPAGCGTSKSVCYYEAKNYSLFQDQGFVVSLPSNIVKVVMP